jgi:hypothetical protein
MTDTSSASGSFMNTSTTDQARLVIVGATGIVPAVEPPTPSSGCVVVTF